MTTVVKKGIPEPLSIGEETLAWHMSLEGIVYRREVCLIPDRKWCWDFVIEPDLAIEVQGGTWSRGKNGHSSGSGIRRDAKKANAATVAGYRTLFFTTDMVKSGEARAIILSALERNGTRPRADQR